MQVLDQSKFKFFKKEHAANGELLKILDEGRIIHSEKFGKDDFYLLVETEMSGEKLIRLNNISKKNLVKFYGNDSSTWVDKYCRVNYIRQMVSGEMRDIIILTDPARDVEGNIVTQ